MPKAYLLNPVVFQVMISNTLTDHAFDAPAHEVVESKDHRLLSTR